MSVRHKKAAASLRQHLEESNRLHGLYAEDREFRRTYEKFVGLQLAYFLPQYRDLCDRPGYEQAVNFVITDLSGTAIASRDRDLARVEPLMSRVLPNKALESLALAMELNSRVLGINIEIARCLAEDIDAGRPVSERSYCRASRQVASFADCRELIRLTRRAGESLDRFARAPMVHSLLRSMALPAKAAGLGDLHAFLDKGLRTFVGVRDIDRFLDVMEERMTAVFFRVFAENLDLLDGSALAA